MKRGEAVRTIDSEWFVRTVFCTRIDTYARIVSVTGLLRVERKEKFRVIYHATKSGIYVGRQMSVTATVQERSASETIIETIAARKGVEPDDLDVPLFEAIDPEALDRLVRHESAEQSRTPLLIGFRYAGYDVKVTSKGQVRISENQ